MSELLLRLESLAHTLPQRPETAIVLTLAAYFAGLRLFSWLRSPAWCPPILLAACLLAGLLALLPLGYTEYRRGVGWLTWLLGPATVALGVPLYQQVHHIRTLWKPIVLTLPPAAMPAAGYAVGVNGHAIGTVRAFDIGPTAGAFASLGMSLTGVFTALWLPLMWHFVG